MNMTTERPPVKTTSVHVTPSDEHLIVALFPTRKGEQRHIKHLWDNNYRINFWVTAGRAHITRSYFVRVLDEKVYTPIASGEYVLVDIPV